MGIWVWYGAGVWAFWKTGVESVEYTESKHSTCCCENKKNDKMRKPKKYFRYEERGVTAYGWFKKTSLPPHPKVTQWVNSESKKKIGMSREGVRTGVRRRRLTCRLPQKDPDSANIAFYSQQISIQYRLSKTTKEAKAKIWPLYTILAPSSHHSTPPNQTPLLPQQSHPSEGSVPIPLPQKRNKKELTITIIDWSKSQNRKCKKIQPKASPVRCLRVLLSHTISTPPLPTPSNFNDHPQYQTLTPFPTSHPQPAHSSRISRPQIAYPYAPPYAQKDPI